MSEINTEEKIEELIKIIEVQANYKIIKTELKPEGYAVCTALVDGKDFDCADFEIEVAYTEIGDYIGDPNIALALYKRGIKPQKLTPDSNVCQIGFCEEEQKWYGWSHRAICGFGIGDKVAKGDCAYKAENEKDFIEDLLSFWHNEELHTETVAAEHTDAEGTRGVIVTYKYNNKVKNPNLKNTVAAHFHSFPVKFGRGEWTAETLEDAKQMAIDFADNVG